MEAVAFPDVEAAAVAFLRSELAARSDAVHVSTRVPNPRPARLVRVSRTGGGRRNLVQDDAQVTAECWGVDSVKASELCRLVRALLGSMDTGAVWFAGEVGGPVDHPDDLTDSPRYQTTVTLRSRGVAI